MWPGIPDVSRNKNIVLRHPAFRFSSFGEDFDPRRKEFMMKLTLSRLNNNNSSALQSLKMDYHDHDHQQEEQGGGDHHHDGSVLAHHHGKAGDVPFIDFLGVGIS